MVLGAFKIKNNSLKRTEVIEVFREPYLNPSMSCIKMCFYLIQWWGLKDIE